MFSAQHDAIKGTTSGTPGTGSFTPNAAATSGRAWSLVAAGWIGTVRYEDGSNWELAYSYWNGTVLSRPSAGFIDSSSGSQLSLTSSATATLVASVDALEAPIGTSRFSALIGANGSNLGLINDTQSIQGTAGGLQTLATTNFLTEQLAFKLTSLTSANALAGAKTGTGGVFSTASGRGGFDFASRFGCSQLPTGPRLFVGMYDGSYSGSSEPSAQTGNLGAFLLDSTDTNIQFATRDNSTTGKTDTAIALAANGFYLARIWAPPGGAKLYGLLIRLDTGAIWYGSRNTNLPTNGSILVGYSYAGLNGTNTGTAAIIHIGSIITRAPA
jgi:hypothetical protein